MEVVVRDYKKDDLEGVNEVLFEAFSIEKKNFNDSIFKEIVAVVDGNIAGYLLLTKVLNPIKDKYYYLVDYVCVSSKYRNMGIGNKLIDYAEEIARQDKVIYMQLTCSYTRIAAHRLYEKCGFKKRESDIFRKELL